MLFYRYYSITIFKYLIFYIMKMKRALSLVALLSSISVVSINAKDQIDYNNPETCIDNSKVYPLILNYHMDNIEMKRKIIGVVIKYDTDCDGVSDLKVITRGEGSKPVIYSVDRNQDLKPEENYYDARQDGWNGNEVNCNSLDDCMNKAFVKIDTDKKIDT